jgi:hypothetical protein
MSPALPEPGPDAGQGPSRMRAIATTWWPLALSWLLMGAEQPMIAAVVARLPQAEGNLAAYGGVVFPLALVIEAPVIMLLAASTELSRDRDAYRALSRFTHRIGAVMTVLHLLLVATPAFDVLVGDLLAVPESARSPARIGLVCMLPWTWAIASRRFHQGVLIRFGQPRAVTVGTGIRLCSTISVLGLGAWLDIRPGVAVGAASLSAGVVAEALYAAWRVRPVVRGPLNDAPILRPPLRGREFLAFYVPLAMMPLVTLVVLPFGTAALSRMHDPMPSLAVWPMISSLLFVLQTVGLAYNEVVVAQLDDPAARPALWRFTLLLVGSTTLAIAILSLPPVSRLWFSGVSGLSPDLAERAVGALWIGIPIPAMRALQSWYQGQLVHARRTRGISEAVLVFAIVDAAILVSGVQLAWSSGLRVALVAFCAARVAQTIWLAVLARREASRAEADLTSGRSAEGGR